MSMLNLENERLRNDIPAPVNITDILDDILQKTNNIHVAFLFSAVGSPLLQKLTRCLCSSKKSLNYSGWIELGVKLGLDPMLPNCVENWNFMNQDPVYTMLIPYTQLEDATIGKIFQGLYDLKRYDVIIITNEDVENFYTEMCEKFDLSNQKGMIKPRIMPTVPHIFQNLANKIVKNEILRQEKFEETKCKAQRSINNNEIGKIILLTCSSQDLSIAQKVATELRKERNGKKIGIFMLEEQSAKIYEQRENLILKFFCHADYILPIISTDYLNIISQKKIYNSTIDIDSAYAKYIYDLMIDDYINRGCVNKKVRCLIPNDYFYQVQKHYFFKNPIFRTWMQLSDINIFAEKILSSRI